MIYRYLFILSLSVFLITSCNSTDSKEAETLDVGSFEVPDSLMGDDFAPEQDKEIVDDIIQNISSPVEMAALLLDEGIKFNYKFLSSTDNVDEFNTSFKQALNLGVLGADMGYLNMYQKTGSALNYITAIKELSDELKVGQFFNFETLKRLASSNNNLDSLMYLSVSSFDNMDAYLREHSRSNISTLLVTGVWVEGLYLATQVVKEKDNKTIRERIGEQKITLDQLLTVLNHYKKDKRFFNLITHLEKLKEELSKVKITEIEGETEMQEVDGVLMAVSTTTTDVEITDEQLASIITAVEEVRSFVIAIQ
jgi:hypothetical protein